MTQYCDRFADLGLTPKDDITESAKTALKWAYSTTFECKVIKGRHQQGLAKSRNYKKYIREFASSDPKPDPSQVLSAVWAYAEKAAK